MAAIWPPFLCVWRLALLLFLCRLGFLLGDHFWGAFHVDGAIVVHCGLELNVVTCVALQGILVIHRPHFLIGVVYKNQFLPGIGAFLCARRVNFGAALSVTDHALELHGLRRGGFLVLLGGVCGKGRHATHEHEGKDCSHHLLHGPSPVRAVSRRVRFRCRGWRLSSPLYST